VDESLGGVELGSALGVDLIRRRGRHAAQSAERVVAPE
jgi:hypothetical protein